jgi:hypothetical protein
MKTIQKEQLSLNGKFGSEDSTQAIARNMKTFLRLLLKKQLLRDGIN